METAPWIPNAEVADKAFHKDSRRISGHLRGIDLMLRWATEGHFKSTFLGTAHLYYCVVCNLEELIMLTDEVICITDK